MRPALPFCLIAVYSTCVLSSSWAALSPEEAAMQHMSQISSVLAIASKPHSSFSFSTPTLVTQAPEQIYRSELPPVWFILIEAEAGRKGYAMWESSGSGTLLEFAIDAPVQVTPGRGRMIASVPVLQQFPVPGLKVKTVASGCVPTAGASLVGYWAKCGFPQWLGAAAPEADPAEREPLKRVASRLRNGMRMSEIPDTAGYTDDGLCLSGAYPEELARALERDARASGIMAGVEYGRFAFSRFRQEIDADRPVLLSCMVRLPHKPHLSWGHEVVGVGWLEVEGGEFAGVKDNFYPTTSPDAVRWIRKDAFDSMISVRLEGGQAGGGSDGAKAPNEQNNTH